MKRIAFLTLGVSLATAGVLAQQQAARPPKPGVKAVQRPMSMIVPDAEYSTPGGPDWLAAGENQVWTNNRCSCVTAGPSISI